MEYETNENIPIRNKDPTQAINIVSILANSFWRLYRKK